MASQQHELEEERRQLLLHEQSLVKDLEKLHAHLNQLDDEILRLQRVRAKSSTVTKNDAWQCPCGNTLPVERRRCGKCLRWKGGKRLPGNSVQSYPIVRNVEGGTKRKRGDKTIDDVTVNTSLKIEEQAAIASLLSLRILA